MSTIIVTADPKSSGPRPSGRHLELLNEVIGTANRLAGFAQSEADGVCDGQGFWMVSDPLMTTAQKLLQLIEERAVTARR